MLQSSIPSNWNDLLKELPADIEETAREYGAIKRRRGIASAADLLHVGLAYVLTDFSFTDVAHWARQTETGYLSQEALIKRIKNGADWFEALLGQCLSQNTLRSAPQNGQSSSSIYLLDATSLSKPGSSGTDYRVHLGLDLSTLQIRQTVIEDASVAEGLGHFQLKKGDLSVADRAYGHCAAVAEIAEKGAEIIVRMKCSHNGLRHPGTNKPFEVLKALGTLAPGEVGDFPVLLANKEVSTPGRLIAIRQSPEAYERAKKKVKRKAQRNSRPVSVSALEAAQYIFLFTTLNEETSAQEVLDLYRVRWQIELCFKRLKSLLNLDVITVKDPQLCRSFIALKLIGGLLVQRIIDRTVGFSPSAISVDAVASVH